MPEDNRGVLMNEALIQKWNPFVEDVQNPYQKNLIATCLENVSVYLAAMEAAADEPVGRFSRYAVPLTRRILHDLAIQELISIQPLGQPDGKVFFLDFMHTNTKSLITSGDNIADKLDYMYSNSTNKGEAAANLEMSFTSSPVSATAKKLTGNLYIEDEQDLYTYYGMSGEDEMLKVLGTQIIREMNKRIVEMLVAGATAASVSFSSTVPTSGVYSTLDPKVYKKKVYESIVDADNEIFKKRFVTPNWIIASGDACAFLEKLEDFTVENNPSQNQMMTGLYRFGTLKGRWKIYKYAYMPAADQMLIGYKGPTEFETGFVYAPYIAAYTTPTFVNPNTFKKSRGMMTRSAEKLVDGNFYAKVTISGL